MPPDSLIRSFLKTYQGLDVDEFSNVLLLEFCSQEKELEYIRDIVTAPTAIGFMRVSCWSILIMASIVLAQSITSGSIITFAAQAILCLSVYSLTYHLQRVAVLNNFGRLVALAIGLHLLTPILQVGLSVRLRSSENQSIEPYDIDVNFFFFYFSTLVLVPVTVRNCLHLSSTFVLGYIFVTLSLFPSGSIGITFFLSVLASIAYSVNGFISMYWIELERRQTWLIKSRIGPKLKTKYFVPPVEYPPKSAIIQYYKVLYYNIKNRKKLVKEINPEFHKFAVETVRERFLFLVFTYIVITILSILRHYLLTTKGSRDGVMIGLGVSVFFVGALAWIANRRWKSTLPCFAAFTIFSVFFAFASTYDIVVLKGDIAFYNFLFPLFDVAITAYIPPHTSLLMYLIVAISSIFFSLACNNFQLLNRELVIPLIGGLPSLLVFWFPLYGASVLRKEILQELFHARKVSGELSNNEVALKGSRLELISILRGSVLNVFQKSHRSIPTADDIGSHNSHLATPNDRKE